MPLYAVAVDVTKAYDTMSRDELWDIIQHTVTEVGSRPRWRRREGKGQEGCRHILQHSVLPDMLWTFCPKHALTIAPSVHRFVVSISDPNRVLLSCPKPYPE